MMHAIEIEDQNGQSVYIHHNSDWSGMAIVSWLDRGDTEQQMSVEIPGSLLVAIAKELAPEPELPDRLIARELEDGFYLVYKAIQDLKQQLKDNANVGLSGPG